MLACCQSLLLLLLLLLKLAFLLLAKSGRSTLDTTKGIKTRWLTPS